MYGPRFLAMGEVTCDREIDRVYDFLDKNKKGINMSPYSDLPGALLKVLPSIA